MGYVSKKIKLMVLVIGYLLISSKISAGLIAEWHLNESSGTTVSDSSSNANTGTMYNMDAATDWVPGKIGNALDFDGVDDYVDCGNSSSLLPTGSFSVSAWIYSRGYVSNGSAYNAPLARGNPFANGDVGGYGFGFTSDNELQFYANATGVCSGVDISNRWAYAVAVYDGTEGKLKIYVDGTLRNVTNFSGLGTDTKNFYIGQDSTGIRLFNGLIDEVQIYDNALSDGEIQNIYITGSSLGEWHLNETSGTTVTDSSANANNGTMYNMDQATDWVPGKIGNALDFDGVNDYVDCGNDSSLLPSGSFSLSAWIYSRGFSNKGSAYNCILARGNPFSQGGSYGFAIDSTDTLRFVANNARALSNINIKDRLVYAVGVYDSAENKLKIYIDGILTGETTCSGLLTDTQTFFIGRDNQSTLRSFNGWVDDVRLCNEGFDSRMVFQNYQKGNLIASWHFDESSGASLTDDSPNQNNGTLTNMNTSTCWTNSRVGNALDFDGTVGYVDCGNDSSLLPSGSFSVSAWIYSNGYVNSGSVYNIMLARGNPFSQGGGYGFAIDSTETLRFVANNARALSGVNIKGRWVYAVGVYDSYEGKLKIYIDGVLEGETSCSGLISDTQNFFIGKDSLNARYFNGLVDEVQIHNIAIEPRPLAKYKTFHNNDTMNIVPDWLWPDPTVPITNTALHESFNSMAGKVDVHLLSPGQSWIPLWISEVYPADVHYTNWDDDPDRASSAWGEYMKAGGDILQEFIDRCRSTEQAEQIPFVSIRLNDVHNLIYGDLGDYDNKYNEWISAFCWSNLANLVDPLVPTKGWDWAVSDIPGHKLDFIKEICKNYAIDGIELDFLRFPSFFNTDETTSDERREIMNKFVSDVRAALDDTTGPYRWLSVRVPCHLKDYDDLGLDIQSLSDIGVDIFNVSSFFPNVQQTTDIGLIRKMIPNKCLLYELEYFSFEVEDGDKKIRIPTPDEQLYTTANLMYKHGIDGIEWFNFDYFPQFGISKPYYLIENIENREFVATRTQQWYFQANNGKTTELPRSYIAGKSYRYTLDLALTSSLSSGDGLFRLMTEADCSGCSWTVNINGQTLSSTSFVSEPIDHEYLVSPVPVPEPAWYSTLTDSTRYSSFLVPQSILHDGINTITIQMTSGSGTQKLIYFDLVLPPDS